MFIKYTLAGACMSCMLACSSQQVYEKSFSAKNYQTLAPMVLEQRFIRGSLYDSAIMTVQIYKKLQEVPFSSETVINKKINVPAGAVISSVKTGIVVSRENGFVREKRFLPLVTVQFEGHKYENVKASYLVRNDLGYSKAQGCFLFPDPKLIAPYVSE